MKKIPINIDKKTVIIGASVLSAVIVLIIVGVLIFALSGKDNKESTDNKGSAATTEDTAPDESPEFDTSVVGDAALDPENQELFDEEGAEVRAEELYEETGRSNGIDD